MCTPSAKFAQRVGPQHTVKFIMELLGRGRGGMGWGGVVKAIRANLFRTGDKWAVCAGQLLPTVLVSLHCYSPVTSRADRFRSGALHAGHSRCILLRWATRSTQGLHHAHKNSLKLRAGLPSLPQVTGLQHPDHEVKATMQRV